MFILKKFYPRKGDREEISIVTPTGTDLPQPVKKLASWDERKKKGDNITWIYKTHGSHKFFKNFVRRFEEAGYEIMDRSDDGNRIDFQKV